MGVDWIFLLGGKGLDSWSLSLVWSDNLAGTVTCQMLAKVTILQNGFFLWVLQMDATRYFFLCWLNIVINTNVIGLSRQMSMLPADALTSRWTRYQLPPPTRLLVEIELDDRGPRTAVEFPFGVKVSKSISDGHLLGLLQRWCPGQIHSKSQ